MQEPGNLVRRAVERMPECGSLPRAGRVPAPRVGRSGVAGPGPRHADGASALRQLPLAAGHLLDMRGVHQQEGEVALESTPAHREYRTSMALLLQRPGGVSPQQSAEHSSAGGSSRARPRSAASSHGGDAVFGYWAAVGAGAAGGAWNGSSATADHS